MDKDAVILRNARTEYGKEIRKAYEKHEVDEKRGNMTKLEPRTDGISNTLTTVQKDNLVLETVCAIDEQNMSVRHDTFGTLTTDGSSPKHNNRVLEKVGIRQPTKKGYIECEINGVADFAYPTTKTRRGRVQGGGTVCPTITAQSMGVCKIERNPVVWGGLQEHQTPRTDGITPSLTAAMGMGGGQTPIFLEEGAEELDAKKVGQVSTDGSQCGSVYDENGSSPTLVAGSHGDANAKICTQYRIRKLTPRECWRLMGFTDEDYEKAEKVNSNTQLYKQAGNSIVAPVLEAIFGQMIDPNFFKQNARSNKQKEEEDV